MAVILSSTNLLASHCLYNFAISYLLLTSPQIVVQHSLVRNLGISLRLAPASPPPSPLDLSNSATIRSTLSALSAESPPGVPYPTDLFAGPNAATAFAALLLAFYALSDAVGTSLSEPCFGNYWTAQAMARLLALFALEAWIYVSRPDPASLGGSSPETTGKTMPQSASAAGLKSDVVFAWAFLELVWMFWVFYVLRKERSREALTREQRRKTEEQRL